MTVGEKWRFVDTRYIFEITKTYTYMSRKFVSYRYMSGPAAGYEKRDVPEGDIAELVERVLP